MCGPRDPYPGKSGVIEEGVLPSRFKDFKKMKTRLLAFKGEER
jgi:hypothetical protein